MNKAQREILRKTRVLEHALEIRQHAKDLPLLRRLEVGGFSVQRGRTYHNTCH